MEPLIFEDFDGPYTNRVSPDGVWRLAGPWTGTGGNFLDPNLANVSGGELSLTVADNERRGSEIQTLDGYSYGYYETSMQVSPTRGVVNSFFVIAEGYDPGTIEIDVEFLTNESWINSPDSGVSISSFIRPTSSGSSTCRSTRRSTSTATDSCGSRARSPTRSTGKSWPSTRIRARTSVTPRPTS